MILRNEIRKVRWWSCVSKCRKRLWVWQWKWAVQEIYSYLITHYQNPQHAFLSFGPETGLCWRKVLYSIVQIYTDYFILTTAVAVPNTYCTAGPIQGRFLTRGQPLPLTVHGLCHCMSRWAYHDHSDRSARTTHTDPHLTSEKQIVTISRMYMNLIKH